MRHRHSSVHVHVCVGIYKYSFDVADATMVTSFSDSLLEMRQDGLAGQRGRSWAGRGEGGEQGGVRWRRKEGGEGGEGRGGAAVAGWLIECLQSVS